MALYDREFVDKFADIVGEMTMDEIRTLDDEMETGTQFTFEVQNQEWCIVHKNSVDEHCRDYLSEQADEVAEYTLRDVEEHLKHLVTFDREGYIDMEIDGGYEYVLAYYDHVEHELGNWLAYRQG